MDSKVKQTLAGRLVQERDPRSQYTDKQAMGEEPELSGMSEGHIQAAHEIASAMEGSDHVGLATALRAFVGLSRSKE
jgi:hypothetical protein